MTFSTILAPFKADLKQIFLQIWLERKKRLNYLSVNATTKVGCQFFGRIRNSFTKTEVLLNTCPLIQWHLPIQGSFSNSATTFTQRH
jgi:hypothetical protein